MKRYLALIFCFALIFSFAACLKKDNTADSGGQSVTDETETLTGEITEDTGLSEEETLTETPETGPSETAAESTAGESVSSVKETEKPQTTKAGKTAKETSAPKTTAAKTTAAAKTTTAAAKTTAAQTSSAKTTQAKTTRPERSTRTPVSAPATGLVTSASTTRARGGVPQTGQTVTGQTSSNPPATRQTTTATTQKTKTVTLIIDCTNAVKYKEKTGKDVTIPPNSNGIVFRTEVGLEDGDTVMSILKRAAKEKGIDIASSYNYVKGIGGLREKNCGSSSGWLYSVNGEYPNVGAEQYKPAAGDVIKWEYTVEPGDTGYKM